MFASRLGRRVFFLFITCALIPLVCLSLFTLGKVSSDLESEARQATRRVSKSTGMSILERLHILELDLRMAAQLGAHSTHASEADPAHLGGGEVSVGRFAALVHQGCERQNLQSDVESFHLPQLSAAEQAHLDGGGVVVTSCPGRSGVPEVVMSIRVDIADSSKGILFAWPEPEELWLNAGLDEGTGHILVLDRKQNALYDTGQHAVTVPGLRAARDGSSSTGNFDWQTTAGDAYVAGYWDIFMLPQYAANWTVVTSRSLDSVMAPRAEFTWSFFLLSAATFLLVLVLALNQISRLVTPIRVLQDATRRIRGNDLETRVVVDSNDEFAQLGESFNDMLDRLQSSIERRETIQRSLQMARDSALAAAENEVEIMTNVSHELRTPITSIRAFAWILVNHGLDSGDAPEFVRNILTESERISRLLESMLRLSAIQEGNVEIVPIALSLGDSVAETCRALGAVAQGEQVELRFVAPAEDVMVLADADQLAQVWANILGNALKFAPPGSVVEVVVRVDQQDGIVEVRDSGPGIAEKDHALIFERFRQATNNLTDKPSGTGLGLTIAREIIASFDGQIEVESELGAGAVFRVVFSLVAESQAALPASSMAAQE